MADIALLREKLSGLFGAVTTRLSPNRSSRRGADVRGIVIHTTEGSYASAVNWFLNANSEVSSHYVVSDARSPGLWSAVTAMVPEAEKAWTARSANPVTINYELAGYAKRTRTDWLGPYRQQLETTAALVAEDCVQYNIPVKRGFPGILGHGDLRDYGFPNDHTDPGAGFPWDVFLRLVAEYVRLGDKPETVPVVVRAPGRPEGVPKRIPAWAWAMMSWHNTGRVGERPAEAPVRIPDWYWAWRRWKLGVTDHKPPVV